MRETQFLILMYNGMYVDMTLLEKGIYTCPLPRLHDKHTTIKTLTDSAKMCIDMIGNKFISDQYIENLKLCSLEKVSIVGV